MAALPPIESGGHRAQGFPGLECRKMGDSGLPSHGYWTVVAQPNKPEKVALLIVFFSLHSRAQFQGAENGGTRVSDIQNDYKTAIFY
jgi:hypothetical protein